MTTGITSFGHQSDNLSPLDVPAIVHIVLLLPCLFLLEGQRVGLFLDPTLFLEVLERLLAGPLLFEGLVLVPDRELRDPRPDRKGIVIPLDVVLHVELLESGGRETAGERVLRKTVFSGENNGLEFTKKTKSGNRTHSGFRNALTFFFVGSEMNLGRW